jgi:Uncharacterized protein conserved in bacteria
MKLLFDENLSRKLVPLLAAEYPGSIHVEHASLLEADDVTVWTYAASNGFIIASKDSDFQQRSLTRGHPPKGLWLRVGNAPTSAVVQLLRSRLIEVAAFAADPKRSVLALS